MGSAKTPEDVSIDFSLDGKTTKRSLASPIKIPACQDDLKAHSLQLRVLRLGLLQDGDVGIGVFPEGEEVFVGSKRPHAGSIGIRSLRGSRLQGVGTSQPQMRQGPRPAVPDNPAVVENPRKLGGSRAALSGC